MKKFSIPFLSFSLILLSLFSKAQTTDDVFNSSKPITWLGIDFSDVRFIGPASGWGEVSTKSSGEMRDKYFPEWNNLILREPKAFKMEDAVDRSTIEMYTDAINKVNEKMNKKEIFTESSSDYKHLKEADIRDMVKKYELKGKSGIGMVLIAEGMNKNLEEGSYWVTFIDMSSKKELYTTRVIGKAGGFGFRNYWAGSVKSVFKTMKKEFKKWD
jgi:hypothetical protein